MVLSDTMEIRGETLMVREIIRRKLVEEAWGKSYNTWLSRLRAAAAIEKKPLSE